MEGSFESPARRSIIANERREERWVSRHWEKMDADADVRGFNVFDRHGQKLGYVVDIYLDVQESKIRYLEINKFDEDVGGDDNFIIPVDLITEIQDSKIYVSLGADEILDPDGYDLDETYRAESYEMISMHEASELSPFYYWPSTLPFANRIF